MVLAEVVVALDLVVLVAVLPAPLPPGPELAVVRPVALPPGSELAVALPPGREVAALLLVQGLVASESLDSR